MDPSKRAQIRLNLGSRLRENALLEARIIGVIRLANKKRKLLVTFGTNARSADRAFALKRDSLFKRIWARLLRSILFADWLTSFDRWMRMKVPHILRQSALFKPNHSNWSYYLQLYFKIIISIYNFCNGKVSWAINRRFVCNIDHCK